MGIDETAATSATVRGMYQPLRPCPACARHVLHDEAACPFCAAPLAPGAPEPARADAPRMSRSAMLLLGSAVLLEACPQPQVAAVYGAPPTPSVAAPSTTPAPSRATPRTAPDDPGSSAEVYGAPPPRPAQGDGGPGQKP